MFLENLLFTFNIVLTVIFTIAITGFYILYKKNMHKRYKYLSILFVLLVIENSIIYLSEFSSNFEILYETSDTLYMLIYSLFIAIVIFSRLITSEIFHDKVTSREFKFNVILLTMTLAIYMLSEFEFAELIIYSYFYLALAYISFRSFIQIKKDRLNYSKSIVKISILFTIFVSLACLAGVLESFSYYKSYSDLISSNSAALSLEYRNLSFDFIKLLSSALAIVYLKYSFDNLFVKNHVVETSSESINERKLNDFISEHSITSRQEEIIKLIVDGDSNKEISEKLFITEGTVKTHIYNIFKKVDVSSRTQLLNKILKD